MIAEIRYVYYLLITIIYYLSFSNGGDLVACIKQLMYISVKLTLFVTLPSLGCTQVSRSIFDCRLGANELINCLLQAYKRDNLIFAETYLS